MPARSWKDTRLYTEVARRGSEASVADRLLTRHMPTIEVLLRAGGTGPQDFTLHDDQHAWRVAERMMDIVPPDVSRALSQYELALLLFAAYLHDIGMVPKRQWLTTLRDHLLFATWTRHDERGLSDSLDDSEREAFEDWLILNTDLKPGVFKGTAPDSDQLAAAEDAIARYCRERHNEWGKYYISDLLAAEPAFYPGWREDLLLLCQSHHKGFRTLVSSEFDPRLVGSTDDYVHLRYLACMLRVADVLEFDPERTPAVVFRHRAIKPSSRIYWWKDHEIRWRLDDDYRLTISARPPDASIHRAVIETADAVERELSLCRRLHDETNFQAGASSHRLPHRWVLSASVRTDVQARHESYEYVDGSFRPDTRRILQLLGGLSLYGHQFVAVRELLQNAFDAVREEIAYESLSRRVIGGFGPLTDVDVSHAVRLELRAENGRLWLVCRDTGAGMTKEILERFFLVSGATRRPDLVSLERQCREQGVTLFRAARFGIGVLSYFLIADRLELRTRRSNKSGDLDGTGWYFETEGIGSFGELRRLPSWRIGTEVRLRLRRLTVGEEIGDFREQLLHYLTWLLGRIPCRLTLAVDTNRVMNPGWVLGPNELTDLQAEYTAKGIENAGTLVGDVGTQKNKQYLAMYKKSLRFSQLELNSGTPTVLVRSHMPWHDLPIGPSLAFFECDSTNSIRAGLFADGALSEGRMLVSINGLRIGSITLGEPFESFRWRFSVLTEIDLLDDSLGTLNAGRDHFWFSKDGARIIHGVVSSSIDAAKRELEALPISGVTYLNQRIAGAQATAAPAGFFPERANAPWRKRLREPNYPVTTRWEFARDMPEALVIAGTGEALEWVYPHKLVYHGDRGSTSGADETFFGSSHGPDKVMLWRREETFELVPIWEKAPQLKKGNTRMKLSSFPEGWHLVVGGHPSRDFTHHGAFYGALNAESIIASYWSEESFSHCDAIISGTRQTPPIQQLLDDPTTAATWIAMVLQRSWAVHELACLEDQHPGFFLRLVDLLMGQERLTSGHLLWWREDGDMVSVGTDGVKLVRATDLIGTEVPYPDQRWLVRPLVKA